MDIKKPNEEGSAPFNMAIDTLQGLGRIRDMIITIKSDPRLSKEQKQETTISLVRSFYINSSPLLKQDVVEKYKEILDLKSIQAEGVNEFGKKSGKIHNIFSFELESKLDKYLIDLQQELQKEKYYMPPRNDPRFSWKQE